MIRELLASYLQRTGERHQVPPARERASSAAVTNCAERPRAPA